MSYPTGTPNEVAKMVCDNLRVIHKGVAKDVKELADYIKTNEFEAPADKGEMIANAMLAYRCLEDASMRIGKVLQALNGGDSIYDRNAVGNPDTPTTSGVKTETPDNTETPVGA